MLDRNCNYLTAIAISVIISFVFTILFYTGVITEITSVFIFSLSLALLSLLLIGLFGISDNGLTRSRLCRNCLNLIISIIGNILFSLLSLTIPLTTRNHFFNNIGSNLYFFLYLKSNQFNCHATFYY